jgi:hypothetical protein
MTASVYTPEEERLAEAVDEAMRHYVLAEQIGQIPKGMSINIGRAIVQVAERYAVAMPEHHRVGFFLLCGLSPASIEVICGQVKKAEALKAEFGTLEPFAIHNARVARREKDKAQAEKDKPAAKKKAPARKAAKKVH